MRVKDWGCIADPIAVMRARKGKNISRGNSKGHKSQDKRSPQEIWGKKYGPVQKDTGQYL
jgi:hypothetical protein